MFNPSKPTLIIRVRGGGVSAVETNLPPNQRPEIIVVDMDADEGDENDLRSNTVVVTDHAGCETACTVSRDVDIVTMTGDSPGERAVREGAVKETTREIMDWVERSHADESRALDELVQDAAQEAALAALNEIEHGAAQDFHISTVEVIAAEINNLGIQEQIMYLLRNDVPKNVILETFKGEQQP